MVKSRHKIQHSPLMILLLMIIHLSNANAYTIKGKIRISHSDSDTENKDHSDAVIYLTDLSSPNSTNKTHHLPQENKQFSKRVLPITQGDSVTFENKDAVFHNVWSLSKSRPFDLGTYKKPQSKTIAFEKAGLVKIFCNIHPEMISSILVLKNNFYTVSNEQGQFEINNIPNSKFTVRVWVEGGTPLMREVDFTKTKGSVVHLNFDIKRKLRSKFHLNKLGKPYRKY